MGMQAPSLIRSDGAADLCKWANRMEVAMKTINKISTPVLAFLALILFGATNIKAAPGDLDPTFSGDGKLTDWAGYATGVVIQPDGKIVVAFGPDFSVARYNPDGSRDVSFGDNGRATTTFGSEYALAIGIAIQLDGKIVVAGYVCPCDDWGNAAFAVARFNPDGSLDLSFDGDGKVTTAIGGRTTGYSVTVQPDNKIIVAGWSWEAAPPYVKDHFAVARYNPDGSLDTTFGGDGTVTTSICANCNDEAFSVAVQPDGKIVAVGGGFDGTSNSKFEAVRYNANGSLDTTFDSDGIVTTSFGVGQVANAVAIQGDGKIVFGGVVLGPSSPEFALARYNSNGSLDTTFDFDGKVTTPMGFGGGVSSIAIQSDEKIIAFGSSSGGFDGNYEDFTIARYKHDGSLDSTYGNGGIASVDFDSTNEAPFGMALDNVGRSVVVGQSGQNIAIARLLVAPESAIFDFDGDGKTDTSVFNSSDGVWRVRNASGDRNYTWGIPGDQLVPADFDGDGKADVAVWRPSTGEWFVINSRDGAFSKSTWGVVEDQPVPADYDGDGRSDLAIYRLSSGQWFIVKTSGGFETRNWGETGDHPIVGDFDGDLRADLSVWRPSSGIWYLNRSTAGIGAVTWGLSTDLVANADYDGDLKDDIAVWRPSTGEWFVIRSSDGAISVSNWGVSGDIPVPGDYDGDGRADFAVYRNGTWYLKRSAAGFETVNLGTADDIPVPAAYFR